MNNFELIESLNRFERRSFVSSGKRASSIYVNLRLTQLKTRFRSQISTSLATHARACTAPMQVPTFVAKTYEFDATTAFFGSACSTVARTYSAIASTGSAMNPSGAYSSTPRRERRIASTCMSKSCRLTLRTSRLLSHL